MNHFYFLRAWVFFIIATLSLLIHAFSFGQSLRVCGTNFDKNQLSGSDLSTYEEHNSYVQTQISANSQNQRTTPRPFNTVGNSESIILIPVVVHVVYNTAAQNISDAQVSN